MAQRFTKFLRGENRRRVAVVGTTGVGLVLLVVLSYATAGAGSGSAFINVQPPEENVTADDSAAGSEESVEEVPAPPATVNGERSQALAADLTAAVEASLDSPELQQSRDTLGGLTLEFSEDVESNGVPFERAFFQSSAVILAVTRGPSVTSIPLHAIDPDGDVTTETWEDGTEAAIRVDGSMVQILFVKNDTLVNLRVSGVGRLAEAPLTVEAVKVLAEAMAAKMAA